MDESSTEEEELDIGSADSYSDQSRRGASIHDYYTDGQYHHHHHHHHHHSGAGTKNTMRILHSSGETKVRTHKRKRNGSISRMCSSKSGSSSIGVSGVGLSIAEAKKRRKSLAFVSSLEKIPSPATNAVDSGESALNTHRSDSWPLSHKKESRCSDDRT